MLLPSSPNRINLKMLKDYLEKMLKTAQYATVSISDNRYISCIRRAGPIKSITIPVVQCNFLVSQKFNVTFEKFVMANGIVITIPRNEEKEDDIINAIRTVEEKVPEEKPMVEYTDPEEVPLVKVNTSNPIIVRSYDSEENTLSILTKEEYEEYSRNELLEFLNLIANEFLPEVIQQEIAPENYQSKNLSKKRCIQIIEQTLLND